MTISDGRVWLPAQPTPCSRRWRDRRIPARPRRGRPPVLGQRRRRFPAAARHRGRAARAARRAGSPRRSRRARAAARLVPEIGFRPVHDDHLFLSVIVHDACPRSCWLFDPLGMRRPRRLAAVGVESPAAAQAAASARLRSSMRLPLPPPVPPLLILAAHRRPGRRRGRWPGLDQVVGRHLER